MEVLYTTLLHGNKIQFILSNDCLCNKNNDGRDDQKNGGDAACMIRTMMAEMIWKHIDF